VLPSAAAGINQEGSNGRQGSQQQMPPSVQQSLNISATQSGNKQADNSQVLSRKLIAVKRSLAKQEEEAAALIQQLQSRDQKLAASEQKLQSLELVSKTQAAEIQSLKKEIASTAGSLHSEIMGKLIDSIQEANSHLCEQFESSPQVCSPHASMHGSRIACRCTAQKIPGAGAESDSAALRLDRGTTPVHIDIC
jgi:hypothetical protein